MTRRLIARGVALVGTLPTVTTADNIHLTLSATTRSAWHQVHIAVGTLFVRLDAIIDENFKLTQAHATNAQSTVPEGECVLF